MHVASEPVVFLDGALVPLSQAGISVFDLGLVQGAGVTEMVRTFGGDPFRLGEHLERLLHSLEAVGFSIPHTRGELADIVGEVVAHNFRLIPESHDLGIVIFVTPGLNRTYTGTTDVTAEPRPTVCIHTFPLPFELWAALVETGQHLVVPSIRQIPSDCIDPRIKIRSRMHWHLADREARTVDPRARALLCDHAGALTETSTANFFIVAGGEILTPGDDMVLNGVSRQVVRELAERNGIPFRPAKLIPADVSRAEEAFTSSTPYCLLPVTRFDGQAVGNGTPGPIFARLMSAWSALVKLDVLEQLRRGAIDRSKNSERAK